MATSDISIEPLLNQGFNPDGSFNVSVANNVGQADHRSAGTANSTPVEIMITTGKRTIEIQNTGSKIIYYGGTGVSSANGLKLFPNQIKSFANVNDTFSIYLVCDGAETSEYRICEYD